MSIASMSSVVVSAAAAATTVLSSSSSIVPTSPSDPTTPTPTPTPSPFAYLVSFLLVGLCWGFTTPFIRRAALTYKPPTATSHPHLFPSASASTSIGSKIYLTIAKTFHTVLSILRKPSYAVPLVCNLTGSIWFFILVGKAELSLTVPITNSLAFLFTVLGEYVAEKKLITRDTWLGMACVCVGIAICVWSKL